MSEPIFMSDLFEQRAAELGDAPYVLFEDGAVSFAAFNRRTRQVANGLAALGARPGEGVAAMMGNCPEYLELLNGLQRGGYYGVPVNIALKGDGLRYILTHSDASVLVMDDVFLPEVHALGSPVGRIRSVLVRRTGGAPVPLSGDLIDLATLWEAPDDPPEHRQETGAMAMLMYTSGTTGFPKAVVNRVRPGGPQGIRALASLWVRPDDVLFTCLPLFHANALSLTAAPAMVWGIPFGLEKRFSASRFWEPIRRWGVTSFNALGAMIPILMKQPERPDDADMAYREVLQRDKESAEPHLAYGDFLANEKKDRLKAIEQYQLALVWKPQDPTPQDRSCDVYIAWAQEHFDKSEWASADARLKDAQKFVTGLATPQALRIKELQGKLAAIRR